VEFLTQAVLRPALPLAAAAAAAEADAAALRYSWLKEK